MSMPLSMPCFPLDAQCPVLVHTSTGVCDSTPAGLHKDALHGASRLKQLFLVRLVCLRAHRARHIHSQSTPDAESILVTQRHRSGVSGYFGAKHGDMKLDSIPQRWRRDSVSVRPAGRHAIHTVGRKFHSVRVTCSWVKFGGVKTSSADCSTDVCLSLRAVWDIGLPIRHNLLTVQTQTQLKDKSRADHGRPLGIRKPDHSLPFIARFFASLAQKLHAFPLLKWAWLPGGWILVQPLEAPCEAHSHVLFAFLLQSSEPRSRSQLARPCLCVNQDKGLFSLQRKREACSTPGAPRIASMFKSIGASTLLTSQDAWAHSPQTVLRTTQLPCIDLHKGKSKILGHTMRRRSPCHRIWCGSGGSVRWLQRVRRT